MPDLMLAQEMPSKINKVYSSSWLVEVQSKSAKEGKASAISSRHPIMCPSWRSVSLRYI